MTMIPHTSTWYQDYRGVLVYKQVQGDFVVTTRVHAVSRSGEGAPRSNYSLAGIMVRTPRNVTPQTWRPGGENYVFLSLGAARQPGRFAFEVKTTIDSRSNLEVTDAQDPQALIQVARIGSDFILLRKDPSAPGRSIAVIIGRNAAGSCKSASRSTPTTARRRNCSHGNRTRKSSEAATQT